MFYSFEIINKLKQNKWFSSWIIVEKNMLVELSIGNYTTLDGLVNGLDGTFQNYINTFSKTTNMDRFP